ncbi:kelch-like protein 5 [Cylas formicarius]|uniref:kelch-like protein 5 n=1 Tax=Cylas formicarius TaxID=197179 RepID=UPI002958601F|nr:kelch-like protein 5 [Cylas formicarius]
MSLSGSISSPCKDSETSESYSMSGSDSNIPRDFSRLSLFSSGSTQDEHFRCEGHAEVSLSCMKKYLQAGKLCDVTLIAGTNGRRVEAHKLVLSAASEYFSAMFTGSLSNNAQNEITLVDINGDLLQAIVNYCYTGTIEIREDNVEVLLSTASLMLLHEVVEACSRFLAHQLHPSNCLGIAIFAEHQSCTSLMHEANSFTSQHFMQVIMNQEFLQLNIDHICSLLSMEDLNVSSEEQVFNALMCWVQHDPIKRDRYMGQLLALVKLPFLSAAFLCDQVEPAIGNDPICQKLIMEAMKWHLLPERRVQMTCARTRPRKATIGRLMIVGGMDSSKGATTIESYDPRSDRWTIAYEMSGKRLQFGIALIADKLLVVGVERPPNDACPERSFEVLKLSPSGDWISLFFSFHSSSSSSFGVGAATSTGKSHSSNVCYATCVRRVVASGVEPSGRLSRVKLKFEFRRPGRWDPATRSWQYVAPMQNQRCSAGVAVLNGKLYAVGGRDGTSCLRTVECYDPHTNKWTLAAPLPTRKGCVGVGTANGQLYVMGGQDAAANNPTASRFDCVDRYDPTTDTWTTVSTLSGKRDAVACTLFGDKLYAVGGYDGNTYLTNVEAYDPITNEWAVLNPLKTGRAGACVIALSNSVYDRSD